MALFRVCLCFRKVVANAAVYKAWYCCLSQRPQAPHLPCPLLHVWWVPSLFLAQSVFLSKPPFLSISLLSHKHTLLLSFAFVLHYAFRGIASVCDGASSLLQSVFSMVKVSGAKLISSIKKQREKGLLCSATVWCTHIACTIAPCFTSFFMGEGSWSAWCELHWLWELNTCG